jgi:hypothetical protein
LLRPCRAIGVDTERLVVRLSLVLDNLQKPQQKGAWRHMLGRQAGPANGPDILHLALPRWAARDSLLAGLVVLGLLGVLVA